MKQLNTIVAVGILFAVSGTLSFAQTNDTLADLTSPTGNHSSLTIGDKTFSGFRFNSSGLTSFDPANIQVTAYQNGGVDYLTWTGNISFTGGGPSTADLVLNYIVSASAGSINMIDQAYTGIALGNGLLGITETVATGSFGGTIVGQSQLSNFDLSDPPTEPNDLLNIVPPQTSLYVTKDIVLAIPNTSLTLVSISQVTQSFHQVVVPEPTTLALAGLSGLASLIVIRSRK